ncbi:restriction endonuclease type II-like protein [Aspergillus pseudotamarii]|uniref:Restriction endonuclease type II-like protein n=1 Tax=Aspergillus pseudotamarii TaxID=132259 RepID=A0A5N6SEF8_ASPPS|nr:restriction endonuclease type II-like protein [Aspergillus pseudotamarii]KAE8132317.1 restriction endonuclease type II-like protein [Aspergillus pseudotamarii]
MVNEYGESTGVDSPSNVEGSSTPRPEASASRQTSTVSVPSKVQQPKPQVLPSRSTPSAILVSTRQKGNPILNHIKLLPWEYADIPADYVVGATTCALFLSLKYHRLHPEYIYSRIRLLAGKYLLRILLIMVDIPNHEDSLKELSKTSIINNLTLTLCWSAPEAAHYLELFKSSENSQPTAIRTQQAQSYKESLVEFVTAPRSINKSDAASLISTFGSLQNAINAQPEQISAVPGWGEKKVRQWCNAVREDFRVEASGKTTAPAQNLSGQKNNEPTSQNSKMSTSTNINNEDEEAMLAAESEGAHVGSQENLVGRVHPDKAAREEGMSDGIVTALAKLRESGG